MKKSIDVLCVGMAAYDLTFSVMRQPEADEKTTARALTLCGGGPAANAAVQAARLGLQAAFCGYFGNDVFGEQHLEELIREGVDTGFAVRGSSPSSVAAILVKADGRRSVVSYRDEASRIATLPFRLADIKPKVLLFDGHEPLISPDLVAEAKQLRIPTVLDAGSVHTGTSALAPIVDYLVASEKFARSYTGRSDPQAMIRSLPAAGNTVVVTMSERGLYWTRGRESGCLAAFPVEQVDSTGAGDAFHGAFASALADGQPFLEALRFSSAAGALCCMGAGARPSLPQRAEIEQFLASRPN